MTKANKGNTSVLIDRHEFDQKTMGAKIDAGFNFDTFNGEVRDTINDSEYILDKEPIEKTILVSSLQPPHL